MWKDCCQKFGINFSRTPFSRLHIHCLLQISISLMVWSGFLHFTRWFLWTCTYVYAKDILYKTDKRKCFDAEKVLFVRPKLIKMQHRLIVPVFISVTYYQDMPYFIENCYNALGSYVYNCVNNFMNLYCILVHGLSILFSWSH